MRRAEQGIALPAGVGEIFCQQGFLLIEVSAVVTDRFGPKRQPRLAHLLFARRSHRCIDARRLIHQIPTVEPYGVCSGEPGVVSAQRFDEVFLGAEYKGPHGEALTPITFREFSIAAPLLALAIFFGVYPQALLNYMQPSVDKTVNELTTWTKANEAAPAANAAANNSANTAANPEQI